jgi:hypothetical protein
LRRLLSGGVGGGGRLLDLWFEGEKFVGLLVIVVG